MTVATPHGSYLTGGELADAVVHASADLARRHEVELIVLPFVDAQGASACATLPIGWGCHIAVLSTGGPGDLVDYDALESIRVAGRSELALRGSAFTADDVASMDWFSE